MKLLLLPLFVYSLAAFAHDGDKVGNGGGGHVCPESVELYDFYEGRHPDLHNINLWVPLPGVPTEEYIELAFRHLAKTHPGLEVGARRILKEILSVPHEQLFKPIKIPRLTDSDIPFVHEDCDYLQIANWNDRFDKLFFSRKLFERMDPMSQAGLLLHEVFYKAGRELNQLQNSNGVRKLIAKMFSFEPVTTKEIRQVMGKAILTAPRTGLCSIKVEFLNAPSESCELNGGPTKLTLGEKFHFFKDNQVNVDCSELYRNREVFLSISANTNYYCDIKLTVENEEYLMEKPYLNDASLKFTTLE